LVVLKGEGEGTRRVDTVEVSCREVQNAVSDDSAAQVDMEKVFDEEGVDMRT
jgi:hypothetical protein